MILAPQYWLFRARGIIEAGVPPGALPIRVCVRSRFFGDGEDICDGLLAMVLADVRQTQVLIPLTESRSI